MSSLCSQIPYWGHWIILLAILTWDFILGETKYGSAFRLITTVVVNFLKKEK
jgi:hypothetical protein